MRTLRPAAFVAVLASLGLSACGGSSAPQPVCSDATTCPAPSGPCQVATCVGGACGTANKAAGTRISDPTPGDCKSNQCDGNGALVVGRADDTDLPSASGACTTGTCSAGVPGQANLPPGTACAVGGGTKCDGAGACVECLTGSDCASGVCGAGGACQTPTCVDGVKNGLETAVDCGGGTCPACPDGKTCGAGSDCQSGVCAGGTCQAPSCTDTVKNGAETDVDCGGPTCPKCAVSQACATGSDCQSGACKGNVCVKALGAACLSAGECGSGFCVDGVCCGSACSGTCLQCNLAGAAGTCSDAPSGTNPRNDCTAASPATCGSTGTCSGAGSCSVYVSGTTCAPASCGVGSATAASTCDGLGTCVAGGTVSCGFYACNPSTAACLTSCASSADCLSGHTCAAGVCQ